MCVFVLKEDILSIFVNGGLINSMKSTVTELGMCTVNVRWQLDVKYYTFKTFIAEYNLAVVLKINHPFRTQIYMNLVFVLM